MSPEEDVLRRGTLYVQDPRNPKNWKKKYITLTKGGILMAEKTEVTLKRTLSLPLVARSKLGSTRPTRDRQEIPLKGTEFKVYTTASMKQKYCFVLETNETIMHMGASSSSEMHNWIVDLKTFLPFSQEEIIQNELRIAGCEILPSELEWSDENIGKGGFGVVKKGRWLKSTDVAIKTINNLPEFVDESEKNSFYKEMELLSQLRHPNVVSMFGFCIKNGYICLVTEYVEQGDLSKLIYNVDEDLSLQIKVNIASNICSGMVYLHNKGVIHRDLKLQNILIESKEEGRVKVCDFGLSKFVPGEETQNTPNLIGSPGYAAPELSSSVHTRKVDVFSFAVVLWELDTRSIAWGNMHHWEIKQKIHSGVRLPVKEDSVFKEIIESSWSHDPTKRPEFTEIYQDLRNILFSKSKLPHQRTDSNFSSGSQPVSLTTSSSSLPEDDDPGEVGYKMRDIFSKQDQIHWGLFAAALTKHSKAPFEIVDDLQFIFEENGYVHKQKLEKFLKWYSPLRTEGTKESYTLSQVHQLISHEAFHGWITAQVAEQKLQDKGEGAYLLRFSSSPKLYVLAAKHHGEVHQWRITTEEDFTLEVNGSKYKDFLGLCSIHRLKPLKIFQLVNTGQEDVYLTGPIKRTQPRRKISNPFSDNYQTITFEEKEQSQREILCSIPHILS